MHCFDEGGPMEPYGPELSTGYYQATPSQTLPPKAGAFIFLLFLFYFGFPNLLRTLAFDLFFLYVMILLVVNEEW